MAQPQIARTDFAAAIAQIVKERNIPAESIYDAIEQALVSAYRKQKGELQDEYYYFAEVDSESGESKIYRCPVTERDEETEEILEWDEDEAVEVTPPGFGRIAAQTAKQVVLQKIRESERDHIIKDFSERLGEVISAKVLRMERRSVVLDLGKGHAYMPPDEQMRGEFYRINSRIAVLVKEIRETDRGQRIIASRADDSLVTKLFAREVPELASGAIEVVDIAREAGVRTKMAVRSTQDGVDPVGSCVGQRGVRVQEVIQELNNEKIDIIPHSDDLQLYVRAALAPAEGLKIDVDEDERLITVTSPDDQLSLVIGRGGQNVRLAAKLIGMKITIQSASGDVQSDVTGDEEYEIDTYEGLSEELREYLVYHKLTTMYDLQRFNDKWEETDRITEEDKDFIRDMIAQAEAVEQKRQEIREEAEARMKAHIMGEDDEDAEADIEDVDAEDAEKRAA